MDKIAFIFVGREFLDQYILRFLLDKNYEVHLIVHNAEPDTLWFFKTIFENSDMLNGNLMLHYGDFSDNTWIIKLIDKYKPHEIYNLAAGYKYFELGQSVEYMTNMIGLMALRVLDAVCLLKLENHTRICQVSTSEIYGNVKEVPQTENTPIYPCSLYSVAKVYAYWTTVSYRSLHGLFACNAILFDHEAPVLGEYGIPRKISKGVARIALGLQNTLLVGNLDAKSDWGHAKEYARMMWLMLQAEVPEDFIVATGKLTTTRELVVMSFAEVGIQLNFKGKGSAEKGYVFSCANTRFQLPKGMEVVAVDPQYYNSMNSNLVVGNAAKAKVKLGWIPEYTFSQMVGEIVAFDLDYLMQSKLCNHDISLNK